MERRKSKTRTGEKGERTERERYREWYREWESLESDRDCFESLEEKIRRLTRRIERLENERKKEEENRIMAGSSSENEDGNGKWDGKPWGFRVDHRWQVNSRMRRRISRAVKAILEETKKW